MATSSTSHPVESSQSASRPPQLKIGFSLLDLLIVLLVLTLILLAAVYQFPTYERAVSPLPPAEEPQPISPSTPSQQ